MTSDWLRERHRQDDMIPPLVAVLGGQGKKITDYYVNLALGGADGGRCEDVAELLPMQHDARGGRVLITGAAGVGKSTLMQHIAYRWGCGDLWQHFDRVYRTTFKSLLRPRCVAFVDKQVDKADTREAKETRGLQAFIAYHLDANEYAAADMVPTIELGDKTLLLADGYDEVRHMEDAEGNFVFTTVRDTLLQQINVVVTTRPGSVGGALRGSFKHFADNLGLDGEGVRDFIKRQYKDDEQRGSALLGLLREQPQLEEICRVPVNTAILCHVWGLGDAEGDAVRKATTVTELYTAMLLHLVRRYVGKYKEAKKLREVVEGLRDIGKCDEVKVLMLLALRNLEDAQGCLTFAAGEVEAAIDETVRNGGREGMVLSDVREVGVLRREGTGAVSSDSLHTFVHLTFQEYLAAYKLLEEAVAAVRGDDKEQVTALTQRVSGMRGNPRYIMVLRFLAGLVWHEGEGVRELFWDAILCNRDGELELQVRSKVELWMGLLGQVPRKSRPSAVGKHYEALLEVVDHELGLGGGIDTQSAVRTLPWGGVLRATGYRDASIDRQGEAVIAAMKRKGSVNFVYYAGLVGWLRMGVVHTDKAMRAVVDSRKAYGEYKTHIQAHLSGARARALLDLGGTRFAEGVLPYALQGREAANDTHDLFKEASADFAHDSPSKEGFTLLLLRLGTQRLVNEALSDGKWQSIDFKLLPSLTLCELFTQAKDKGLLLDLVGSLGTKAPPHELVGLILEEITTALQGKDGVLDEATGIYGPVEEVGTEALVGACLDSVARAVGKDRNFCTEVCETANVLHELFELLQRPVAKPSRRALLWHVTTLAKGKLAGAADADSQFEQKLLDLPFSSIPPDAVPQLMQWSPDAEKPSKRRHRLTCFRRALCEMGAAVVKPFAACLLRDTLAAEDNAQLRTLKSVLAEAGWEGVGETEARDEDADDDCSSPVRDVLKTCLCAVHRADSSVYELAIERLDKQTDGSWSGLAIGEETVICRDGVGLEGLRCLFALLREDLSNITGIAERLAKWRAAHPEEAVRIDGVQRLSHFEGDVLGRPFAGRQVNASRGALSCVAQLMEQEADRPTEEDLKNLTRDVAKDLYRTPSGRSYLSAVYRKVLCEGCAMDTRCSLLQALLSEGPTAAVKRTYSAGGGRGYEVMMQDFPWVVQGEGGHAPHTTVYTITDEASVACLDVAVEGALHEGGNPFAVQYAEHRPLFANNGAYLPRAACDVRDDELTSVFGGQMRRAVVTRVQTSNGTCFVCVERRDAFGMHWVQRYAVAEDGDWDSTAAESSVKLHPGVLAGGTLQKVFGDAPDSELYICSAAAGEAADVRELALQAARGIDTEGVMLFHDELVRKAPWPSTRDQYIEDVLRQANVMEEAEVRGNIDRIKGNTAQWEYYQCVYWSVTALCEAYRVTGSNMVAMKSAGKSLLRTVVEKLVKDAVAAVPMVGGVVTWVLDVASEEYDKYKDALRDAKRDSMLQRLLADKSSLADLNKSIVKAVLTMVRRRERHIAAAGGMVAAIDNKLGDPRQARVPPGASAATKLGALDRRALLQCMTSSKAGGTFEDVAHHVKLDGLGLPTSPVPKATPKPSPPAPAARTATPRKKVQPKSNQSSSCCTGIC